MDFDIKPEMLKEIADYLDTGMVCFYHKTTGELEYYPDEMRNPGYDDELWRDIIDKIDEEEDAWLRLEGMSSSESFRVMESFIDNINHIPTHNKFIDAISRKKPFRHFSDLLFYYPKLREEWFAYKSSRYIEFVKEQIEMECFTDDDDETDTDDDEDIVETVSNRIIRKVAVLGSDGIGSLVACHFANAGLQVLLLDVADSDAKLRNKPASDALTAALKSKPSPVYAKGFVRGITTGSYRYDITKLSEYDWIIDTNDEQQMLHQIDQLRNPGTLVASTSAQLSAIGLSNDFRKHFCRLSFSGQPRYAQSLEIIPTKETLSEVVDFVMLYGEKFLGKDTVLAKDAPFSYQTDEEFADIHGAPVIWKNKGVTITNIGDEILNLEFRTEENAINSEVLDGINHAITLAEENYKGLVIYNDGQNFSSGGDLETIYNLAANKRFDELDKLVKVFQDTIMRIRYSGIPVVAAPHGQAIGPGCEICLHTDKLVAHAELYIGLDEFNSGLIPYGGGAKEFTLRLSDELQEGDIETNNFRQRLLTIAQAGVSTSAYEAFELDYLQKGRDAVVMSRKRLLTEAKKHCLLLADAGYVQPIPRSDIKALGKPALGVGYAGAANMHAGNYISEYDMKLLQRLAFVMAGGDISQPAFVSENYLLALERETFISLCAEAETLGKMQAALAGKTLKN